MLTCSTCGQTALVAPVLAQRGDVRVTVGIVVSCSRCGACACKGDVGETMRRAVMVRGGKVIAA